MTFLNWREHKKRFVISNQKFNLFNLQRSSENRLYCSFQVPPLEKNTNLTSSKESIKKHPQNSAVDQSSGKGD